MKNDDVKRTLGLDDYTHYYRVIVHCANCKASGAVYVRKGVMRPEVVECAECLCRTARPGL